MINFKVKVALLSMSHEVLPTTLVSCNNSFYFPIALCVTRQGVACEGQVCHQCHRAIHRPHQSDGRPRQCQEYLPAQLWGTCGAAGLLQVRDGQSDSRLAAWITCVCTLMIWCRQACDVMPQLSVTPGISMFPNCTLTHWTTWSDSFHSFCIC